MIIWINGAFGAGKTQTAFELKSRMENAHVFDPENIGYYFRENLPKSIQTPDFQDMPEWRSANLSMLKKLDSEFSGNVIVPMTITSPQYFDEIISELRRGGTEVRHFILFASAETLTRRLNSRFERKDAWSRLQIPRCINAFTGDITEGRFDVDNLSVSECAEHIADQCGISLKPVSGSKISRWLKRRAVQIRISDENYD